MPGDTFRCSRCGREFTKAWTDEEARQEMDATWKPHGRELAVVCDDCHTEMLSWVKANHPEWLK